jgi:hypothetical protein
VDYRRASGNEHHRARSLVGGSDRGFAVSPARIEVTAPTTIYNLQPVPIEDGRRYGGARFGGDLARGTGSEGIAYSETNHQTYRGLDTATLALMAWCMSLCQGLGGRPRTLVGDPQTRAVGVGR